MAEQFEAYFRRADLDHDGKISGAEAVAFFQGSNLPKPVLAQIWMHADKSRTGYLGREEFNNALKLVTVAQSKRELTPDIVKAALYGPASAKIPPPQINMSAISAPQSNSSSAAPAPQMGVAAPAPEMMAAPAPRMGMGAPAPRMGMGAPAPRMGMGAPAGSQNMGFRGQVPPTTGLSQQNFPSQNNQSMWPPVPVAAGTAATTPQGIASPNMSTDWLGGRTGGTAVSAAVQTPSSGTGFSMPPDFKPQDPLSISSLTAAKDPKALVGSGNGPALDSTFGGDMFSANQSLPKQVSPVPSYLGIGTASSSAIVPASAGSQSSAKPDPFEALQSTLNRQSPVSQLQQTQSLPKPNQQASAQVTSSLSLSGTPAAVGASISEQSQTPWPKMTRAGVQKYVKVFMEVDTDRDGRISGEQARNLFLSWRLPREVLKQVWDLSDQDSDSMLSLREFCIALYLMERYKEGRSLPSTLPTSIMMDETLFSMAGPPTAAYGAVGWAPAPGLRPQQGLPGGQQLTPGNVRPQMPTMLPQADGSMQFNQQNSRGPVESSPADQLSNGQRSMDEKTPETTETESKAESKENVLLDSKEKLEFYRTKMQDLVLYKSRCDNRLNEITERALADKREAEMLGKKYEEKYKQVAEIASKLTIEEASFREIQERKMELQQAITKMEQGGSADGILQVRADRIQSDLEELLKALAERCRKLGVDLKSTTLIELPPGWQPGIPEIAAVWDEEWDKFDDEGFSFDVALPATAKSSSPQKGGSSPTHSYSPDSMSNPDGKSEYTFNKDTRADVAESAYEHSEDESKSPQASPRRDATSESPTQEYSDNHFRNNFEEDAEAHRSFDEPSWGTFDNNDDIDSVWGFNTKDPDAEKYGEKYFFDSNNSVASPTRSDSLRTESVFEKSSRFAFEDPVPETPLSRAGNSPPRYNAGSGDPFFDSFSRYDSFTTHDRSSSPRRETFTRFDSVNSTSGFDDSRRFSFDDSDPFGSSGPFKVSSESQSPKKGF